DAVCIAVVEEVATSAFGLAEEEEATDGFAIFLSSAAMLCFCRELRLRLCRGGGDRWLCLQRKLFGLERGPPPTSRGSATNPLQIIPVPISSLPVHAPSSRTERAGRVQRARNEALTGSYLSVPLIIGKQAKKKEKRVKRKRRLTKRGGTKRTRLTEQRAPHIRCDATRIPGCCPTLGSRSDVESASGPAGPSKRRRHRVVCCGRLNSLHLTTEEVTAGTAGSRSVAKSVVFPRFTAGVLSIFYVACMLEAAVKEKRFPRVFYRGPAFYFYVACMLCDCSEKDGTPKVFPTGCLAPPPPAGPQPPPPDMESDRRPIHGRNPPPCSPPVPPPRVAHMSLTQVSNSVGLERSISNVVGSDAEMPRPESGKDLN
ncbi:hypothetical protein BHM03_00052096, partial [Ensete ventricosum]